MASIVLQDATVEGMRNFVSKAGKACFVLSLAYHGGSQELFISAQQFQELRAKVKDGDEVDSVVQGKWKPDGKFETLDGGIALYPAGSVVIDTDAITAPPLKTPKVAA